MDRRALLARLGSLPVIGTAGCLADDGAAGTDTPGDQARQTDDGPSSPNERTDASTPPHDAPFPPDRDDVDRVVWFRGVSDPDESLHLAHSSSSVPLPGEVSFTLHNNTGTTFETNFYNWALYRWQNGWHRIAPTEVNDPLMELPPGESHTWSVTVRNDDLEAPIVRSGGTRDLEIGALGGGHYAFTAEGWWRDQDATPAYEHVTVCAARFVLEGDELPLVASNAVTEVRRDGDTVVVRADNPGTDGTPATFVLTRDDAATDPRRLVTEQVYREWPLRDALANAGDAAEVRVETTTGVTPLFGVHEDEEPAVTYDGRSYRIAAEERGD